MKSNFPLFFLLFVLLGSCLRNHCPIMQAHDDLPLCFLLNLLYSFGSHIQVFDILIFIYGVRQVGVPLLSFAFVYPVVPALFVENFHIELSWHTCQKSTIRVSIFISELSILLHFSIYLSLCLLDQYTLSLDNICFVISQKLVNVSPSTVLFQDCVGYFGSFAFLY